MPWSSARKVLSFATSSSKMPSSCVRDRCNRFRDKGNKSLKKRISLKKTSMVKSSSHTQKDLRRSKKIQVNTQSCSMRPRKVQRRRRWRREAPRDQELYQIIRQDSHPRNWGQGIPVRTLARYRSESWVLRLNKAEDLSQPSLRWTLLKTSLLLQKSD